MTSLANIPQYYSTNNISINNNNYTKSHENISETVPVKSFRGRQPRQQKPNGFCPFPSKDVFGNLNYGPKFNNYASVRKVNNH